MTQRSDGPELYLKFTRSNTGSVLCVRCGDLPRHYNHWNPEQQQAFLNRVLARANNITHFGGDRINIIAITRLPHAEWSADAS